MSAYADYLLISERVLLIPAEAIAKLSRTGLAASALAAPLAGFGGLEAYPDFVTKAAGTSSRTHPLAELDESSKEAAAADRRRTSGPA